MTFRSSARDRGPHYTLLIDTGRATYAVPTYVAVTDNDQAVGLQAFQESDLLYIHKISSLAHVPSRPEVGVRALAFPMTVPGPHRFHMADVKFPIDIVWVYQGRIARIVTANPEDRETWSARGQLVFETPAGALSARNVAVGDHVRLIAADSSVGERFGRQGNQLDAKAVVGVGRFELAAAVPLTFPARARLTAQLANAEAAEQAANDGRPQLSDPSALIRGMLEYALDTDPEGREPDPFLEDDKWTANMLTGGQTHSYVIDSATLKRWAIGAGVPPESAGTVAQAALSQRGLLSLGDTLQALGIVDSATPTDQGLVVFRRSDEAPTIQAPAPDPSQVGRVAAKGNARGSGQSGVTWYRGDARADITQSFENQGYQSRNGHAAGPGIYLTTSLEDARRYSENVYACQVSGKLIQESRVTQAQLQKMLSALSPEQRGLLLSNWDENPKTAIRSLFSDMQTNTWLDAALDMTATAGLDTRSKGIEYCDFMRRVFAPACGLIRPAYGQGAATEYHAVVWDPSCVKDIQRVTQVTK